VANPIYQVGALEKVGIWIDADGDGNFTAWDGSISGGGGGGTQYAEDTASAAAEQVMMAGVVRKDSAASLVDADGDRTELQVDAAGALRVTGGGGGTEYTEDAASAANPTGGQVMLRRRDTLSAVEVSADLDVIAANATAKGELYVKHVDSIPVTGTFFQAAQPVTDNAGSLTVDAPVATPVAVRLSDGAAFITALPVTDNAGSLTVDNPILSVVGGGTEAAAQRVTIATDSTGVLSVDDNGSTLTVDAPVGTPVNVQISDGTRTATVRDTGATDSLNVAIVDATGAQITTFGGGTEYTEDAVAVADPIGGATILVRKDTPATLTSADGDNVAQRGTNYGAAYSQIVTSAGAYVDSFGGGTEYTEDAVAAADPLGKATILVRKDTPATLVSADGDNVAQRGTNYGAAYTQIVTSAGAYVDTFGGGTQYTEDAASAADPVGNMMIARRRDTLTASEVSADADNIAVNTTSKGELYVKHTDNVPVQFVNKRIDVTPTIATSGYVTGDQMGAALTFTSAASASGRGGRVVNAMLTSRTPTALNSLNLHLFEATLTLASSDNAALDLTDANLEAAKYIGTINFQAADYYDTTSNAFCPGTHKAGPPSISFVTSGSANLIGVLEVAATPAAQYAGTTDVIVSIEVEQY